MSNMSKLLRSVSLFLCVLLLVSICAFASSESVLAKDESQVAKLVQTYLASLISDYESYETVLDRYNKVEITDLEKKAGMVASYYIDDKNMPDVDYYIVKMTEPTLAEFAKEEAADYNTACYYVNNDQLDLGYEEYIYPALEYFEEIPYITLTMLTDLDGENVFETVLYFKTSTVPIGDSGKSMSIPLGFKRANYEERNAVACYNYSYDEKDNNTGVNYNIPFGNIVIYQGKFDTGEDFYDRIFQECEKENMKLSLVTVDNQQMVKLDAVDKNGTYTVEYWFYDGDNGYTVLFEIPSSDYGFIRPVIQSIH